MNALLFTAVVFGGMNVGTSSAELTAKSQAERWLAKGQKAEMQGHTKRALRAYTKAKRIMPNRIAPCLRAARLHVSQGDTQNALKYTRCARRRGGRTMTLLYEAMALQMEGKLKKAARRYARFAKRHPTHPLANQAAQVGQFASGLE